MNVVAYFFGPPCMSLVFSASEMTYIVSGGALNYIHSLIPVCAL